MMHTRLLVTILLLLGCAGSGKPKGPTLTGEDGDAPPQDGGEEPDDGVDVEYEQGVLDPSDTNPIIEDKANEIEQCFRLNAKARYVGGPMELGFRVAPDGTTVAVTIKDGALGSWPVEKCILAITRQMAFPEPKGGKEATFTVPLDFPPSSSFEEVEGDPEELAKPFAQLAKCDKAAGKPTAAVKVIVYVAAGGKVMSAGFATGETAIADAWSDCAHKKALAWKLTDPRGRVKKVVGWYGQ